MASRAHALHDYSLAQPVPRPRRNAQYRNDEPVELPRSSVWELNGGLLMAAAAACALVAGVTYTTYSSSAPPALAETPAAPLIKSWQPDPQITRALVTEQLSGPAAAVRELSGSNRSARDDSPLPTAPQHEVVIDDSAPGAQGGFPQTAPAFSAPSVPAAASVAPSAPLAPSDAALNPASNGGLASPNAATENPYPNPSTTPPDAVAPSSDAPAHALDPENPY